MTNEKQVASHVTHTDDTDADVLIPVELPVPRTIGGISLGKLDRHRKKYWTTKRHCEAKKIPFDGAIAVPKPLLNQFATNPALEKEYFDWIKTEPEESMDV